MEHTHKPLAKDRIYLCIANQFCGLRRFLCQKKKKEGGLEEHEKRRKEKKGENRFPHSNPQRERIRESALLSYTHVCAPTTRMLHCAPHWRVLP